MPDDGEIVGVTWDDAEQRRYAGKLASLSLSYDITWEGFGGNRVCRILVRHSENPVRLNDKYYRRRGTDGDRSRTGRRSAPLQPNGALAPATAQHRAPAGPF